jgi:hypothetical protein
VGLIFQTFSYDVGEFWEVFLVDFSVADLGTVPGLAHGHGHGFRG